MGTFHYGGQAVMEGVMMRGRGDMAVAVRAADGRILYYQEPLTSWVYRSKVMQWPFLRGIVLLWDSLLLGTRALVFSANVGLQEGDDAPAVTVAPDVMPAIVPDPDKRYGDQAKASEPSELSGAALWGTVAVSLPAALVLRQEFYGRGIARTIIMLPWAISLAMAAIVWLWSFNADYGMINATLQQLGLMTTSVQWMAQARTAFPVEIGVGILVSVPFTTTILLGGLSSIQTQIYEAAAIDGARSWHSFRHLTLPLLAPFINIAVVLNVIHVFNSFPIIWLMTQGGPDNSTHILVTYFYELSFRLGRSGPAAAVSLVMLAVVLCFTAVYIRLRQADPVS